MSPTKRYAKKHAKARQRRRLQAHERLERDRRRAQRTAEALHHALEDLALPERLFEKSSIGGISSVNSGDERQSIPHRPH